MRQHTITDGFRYWLLSLSMGLLLAPWIAHANLPNERTWRVSLEQLEEAVLRPLDERFAENCVSDLKGYYSGYVDLLQSMRAELELDAGIYLLLREALIVSAIELSPYQGIIPCESVDWWSMIRRHVAQKLDLMGNLFALIDDNPPTDSAWNSALEELHSRVLDPLSEHFSNVSCKSDLQPYNDAYIQHLQALSSDLDRQILFLFREALIVSLFELGPYQGVIQCETADWWTLVRGHVEQKLNLMANIIVIVGD